MFPKAARLWAFFCLVLALQLAAAQSFEAARRDDGNRPASTSVTSHDGPNKTPDATGQPDKTPTATPDISSSMAAANKTQSHSPSPMPTIITGNGTLDNSTFVNSTVPAGELPIQPKLTPGWGVAGIIMLLTGVVYTLIGIKNRWIHTFFSTAYMTSLGITVLIIYVMNPPVSTALQGGYVAAVVLSGCLLGAASMFFKELTEGLGCALGGFSLSMWLLCLVPGGLLSAEAAKAIFISVFTLVGFAFYFSRWTRDWALILMISFGGATVTVLGIDCFSRAGLKEFWAYIWNLNGNLFALGVTTYPVTKGIRVETAAIVIIFLIGIISQVKLWKVVREQREKRAAERAEDQRNLDEEEENVGRQIEHQTARERRQWERVYGEGADGSMFTSRETDIGDMGSEKRLRASRSKPLSSTEVIEMTDMSESIHSQAGPRGLMAAEDAAEGKVTVRVAADDIPEYVTDEEAIMDEKAAIEGNEMEKRSSRQSKRATVNGKRTSKAQATTQSPDVVPLPFTVPGNDDARSVASRSSVATFADEAETAAPVPVRHSIVKRLSRTSADMFRSMSQRSSRTNHELHYRNGESAEELVVPTSHRHRDDDDNGSLAATLDDESVSGDGRISAMSTRDIEINAELADEAEAEEVPEPTHTGAAAAAVAAVAEKPTAEQAKETKVDTLNVKKQRASKTPAAPSTNPVETEAVVAEAAETQALDKDAQPSESPVLVDEEMPEPSEKPKSVVSVDSTPASLTKARLPKSLSRVAMSYRTNEWAKHLSNADAPEPDELHIEEAPQATRKTKERTAPVDVVELQKTAEDGAPAPSVRRSESQLSQVSNIRSSLALNRQPSPTALDLQAVSPAERSPIMHSPNSPMRASSTMGLRKSSSGFASVAEKRENAPPHDVILEEAELEADSPAEEYSMTPELSQNESFQQRAPVPGVVSYNSPQTLIGQRELFLRSKSQGSLLPMTPEPPASVYNPHTPSDSGSIYNYPMYAAAAMTGDVDDLPLNQRKEIMRQGSLMSLGGSAASYQPTSNAEATPFNSHQPLRGSGVPTQVARDAKLANFRQSVAQDLRSGTPILTTAGRETPFASTNSLLAGRQSEVQLNIEMQRNVLMGQKEAEGQRREMQRREREFSERVFDDRMRNGELLDAHREALRKLQNSARKR